MEKIMSKLQKNLTPMANAFARNRIMQAIGGGFTSLLPIIIAGAIFSLLAGLDIGGYQEFTKSKGLNDVFNVAVNMTNNILAIYVVFSIAYNMANILDVSGSSLVVGVISLVSFMIVTPVATIKGDNRNVLSYIDMTYLGSRGIFTAIIIAILTAYIYSICIKRNITIKMPAGVPEMVEKSFAAIIPTIFIMIISLTIYFIFHSTQFESIHGFIYGVLGETIKTLQGSIITYIVLTALAGLLWFFGIHGGMVVGPVMFVLFMQPAMENVAAYSAGKPLPNMLTMGYANIACIGGIGSTLGLVILMLLFSKSGHFKTLGKLSFLPGLFAINEPIMFGAQIVLNPVMIIPFIVVPIVNVLLPYILMYFGLLGYPRMPIISGMPVFVDGFLQLGFKGIILQFVQIIISMLMYYPFFKMEDARHYDEEQIAAEKAI
ncbi:PTS transporter subunit EIIC [Clostridium sp. C2-6-12]|uniref:PTS sugar transporter subunit IIC n=1 Tax=Clostridium sp. C2-6-12 TaxID=2698832 RepID=UPI00136AD268|nr:PTS transporter subunit EIIC [Clostridium sp. C2-6-12]